LFVCLLDEHCDPLVLLLCGIKFADDGCVGELLLLVVVARDNLLTNLDLHALKIKI
jgi:hypothetical protein